MRIAIVGAPDSVEKIYRILSSKYENIDFILKKEEKIDNMLKILEEMKDEVDGVYLTGIGVYYGLINNKDFEIERPIVYTKRGSMGLIKSFWNLRNEIGNIDKNIKLGIDVVDEDILLEVIREFDIKLENYFYQKYETTKLETEYLKNYIEKYDSGEINCVFTAFGYIYSVLKERGIPVYRIQATSIEIENEFNYLLDRIKIVDNKRNKIGIKIIQVISKEDEICKRNLRDRLEVEKYLIDYAKEVEGNIQICGEKEYIIISNIEVLKSRENLEKIIQLENLLKEEGKRVAVGIGEGYTIFQAERNARAALKISMAKEGTMYFSNGEEIKGPLLSEKELKYKKVSDEKIKRIATEIGISSNYIEKIRGMMKRQKKDTFTSVEIAELLNITPRSVNRIVKKIVEKKYAENVQVENSVTAGRPRRIIKFYI